MLIVLPPSETKAPGGQGSTLSLEDLSFPQLNDVRRTLVSTLSELSVDETMEQLALGEKLRDDAKANTQLHTSPTCPAIVRYTGVLYDALDASSLDDTSNIAISSALFGLLRAQDPIPRYRLSGGSKLHGRTIKSYWGSSITDVLTKCDFVLDLRSGAYQQLGKLKSAVTVKVEDAETGKVISHFNKHYKGLLARELAGKKASSAAEVAELAHSAGFKVEETSPHQLTLKV